MKIIIDRLPADNIDNFARIKRVRGLARAVMLVGDIVENEGSVHILTEYLSADKRELSLGKCYRASIRGLDGRGGEARHAHLVAVSAGAGTEHAQSLFVFIAVKAYGEQGFTFRKSMRVPAGPHIDRGDGLADISLE